MPILDSSGQPTGFGIILSRVAGVGPIAVRVDGGTSPPTSICWPRSSPQSTWASAYWMLGTWRYVTHPPADLALPGARTVLWYTAAIGSTWFWAHIVASAVCSCPSAWLWPPTAMPPNRGR